MRTSFHTGFLGHLPVLDAVDAVFAAGYDAVELNAETLPWAAPHVTPETPAEVRAAIRARGPVSSIAAHRAGLTSADPETRAAAVAWTIGCARLAVDVGTDIIHVIPGDQPDDGSGIGIAAEPGDLDAFRTSLREVVEASRALGVTVGLEPIVNQLVATTDQTLHVLHAVPGLTVSFDPSHLQVTTGDVDDAARRLGPYVSHAALKDATGTPGDFTFPVLGAGDIDFVPMIRILREAGFDGTVSIEHEAHLFGDRHTPDEVLQLGRPFAQNVISAASRGAEV